MNKTEEADNGNQIVHINLDSCFSCAGCRWKLCTEKKMVKRSEELLVAWVNEDYESRAIATSTLVYQPDGTFEQYTDVLRTALEVDGTFMIEEKWTDSEKNIYYKVKWNYKIRMQENIEFRSIKISDSVNTYEEVFEQRKYPTEIDPINVTYRIRYRQ